MKVRARFVGAAIGGLIGVLIYGAFVVGLAALAGDGDGDYPDWFYVVAFGALFILPAFAVGAILGFIRAPHSN